MKVTYINNHFVVEDKVISIFVEGKLKYTLETSCEDTMDIALTILEKGEEAVALLKDFPEFITVGWAPIASQLKAAGMVLKDDYANFRATATYHLKNHGLLEFDDKNNWIRTRTASGAVYYPEVQPSLDMIKGIINHVVRNDGGFYATSLIKTINEKMKEENK